MLDHLDPALQPLWQRSAIVAAGPLANLLLAVALYAAANWIGVDEPRARLASMLAQMACLGGLIVWSEPAVFVACQLVFQLGNGLMWPVVESYVSAGRSPLETARALGRFNVTWSSTVPTGVMLSGPIIEHGGTWLFGAALIGFVVCLASAPWLPARPAHLSHDAPERLDPTHSLRYQRLLRSSRWLLLFGYTIFFLLPPLMPQLFEDMGHDVATATAVASAIEWARFATFTAMYLTTRWHNRVGLLALCLVMLPLTFVGILVSAAMFKSTVMVVAFSLAFGVVECLIYYAALYYGMVVLNDALFALVQKGIVEPRDAYIKAVDKVGFETMLTRGGFKL